MYIISRFFNFNFAIVPSYCVALYIWLINGTTFT